MRWVVEVITHSHLVQAHLKLIVLLPKNIDGRHGHCDGTVVGLAQLIHLLLILPPGASNLAWSILDKLDIVLPDGPRIPINTDIVDHELV